MSASNYADIARELEQLEDDVLSDQKRLADCIEELSSAHNDFRGTRLYAADDSGAAQEASEHYSDALEALHVAGRALGRYTHESKQLIAAIEHK
jgi:hypothetical protein